LHGRQQGRLGAGAFASRKACPSLPSPAAGRQAFARGAASRRSLTRTNFPAVPPGYFAGVIVHFWKSAVSHAHSWIGVPSEYSEPHGVSDAQELAVGVIS